jgi:hypothetical protein
MLRRALSFTGGGGTKTLAKQTPAIITLDNDRQRSNAEMESLQSRYEVLSPRQPRVEGCSSHLDLGGMDVLAAN